MAKQNSLHKLLNNELLTNKTSKNAQAAIPLFDGADRAKERVAGSDELHSSGSDGSSLGDQSLRALGDKE